MSPCLLERYVGLSKAFEVIVSRPCTTVTMIVPQRVLPVNVVTARLSLAKLKLKVAYRTESLEAT
jgi:hypothetical protein